MSRIIHAAIQRLAQSQSLVEGDVCSEGSACGVRIETAQLHDVSGLELHKGHALSLVRAL
jgi:hypothetical protein